MALFCSQEAANVIQRLSSSNLSPPFTYLQKCKQAVLDSQNWRQHLLLLSYTVEYPFIVVMHPMVVRRSIHDVMLMPDDRQLGAQVLIFFLTDRIVCQLFVRYYTLFSTDESAPALRLSTDFTLPRTTLLLAIMLIQAPWWLGLSSPFKDLHFITVMVWMLLRRWISIS